ncbi:ABC transporter ATP-binding protein [Algivirga pacifica]|uniref:ABC transporter ATP-binding protein n=1 Tax=Algivirga pacifica TaxID=1162670 RepID=A0ABP9DCX3_9BACT
MIQLQKLGFAYSSKTILFNNLNLSLHEGSIVGVLGKNGAGKSSLMKMIAGLLSPQEGTLSVLGYTPSARVPSFLQEVFLLPEEPETPSLSIQEYIQAYSPFYPNFDLNLLEESLRVFELSIGTHLKKLSYGQKKKFMIAFALASRCRLIIMDEPTNGLDIPSKKAFKKLMAGTMNDDQLLLLSTHQINDIESLIDQVVVLDEGKVVYHKGMYQLSKELAFALVPSLEGREVLYSEESVGGYKVITPNQKMDTPVDLELLFNALMKNPNKLDHENN